MKSAQTVIKDLRLSGHTVDRERKLITITRPSEGIHPELLDDVDRHLPGWQVRHQTKSSGNLYTKIR